MFQPANRLCIDRWQRVDTFHHTPTLLLSESGICLSLPPPLQCPTRLAFRSKIPLTNNKTPIPLPLCPENFPTGSNLWRAFQVCKVPESKEQWASFKVDPEGIFLDLTPACAARFLGFAPLFSSSDYGRDALAAEILKCNDEMDDHELLGRLAYLYVYCLIRNCASSVASCLLPC